MEEDQIDVGLAETVAGLEGLLGRVDEPEVDDTDIAGAQSLSHAKVVTGQLVL